MTTLLIIDCQKDFHPGGSLAIPSANDDAARISSLIRSRGDTIDRIVATLDSHHKLHVAHPCFWTNGTTGEHPPPFTIISAKDVETGVWVPRGDVRFGPGRSPRPIFEDDDDCRDGTTTTTTTPSEEDFDVKSHCVEYARRLESRGRFQLTIWPEHCLIGSSGHGVVDCVLDAMNEWSRTTGGIVEWVHKGENLWTEMYSALRAEVPVGGETGFNRALMESTSKITILRDCASSVPGFEEAGKLFLEDMERAGVNVKTSDEI
ncbi:hypothetical protein ACHAW5_006826 [Stephanodiscus triporus]|uniref:Isochorismatase-like domain-containing protein n=1 Tax=Stephanodiscus triporus TaxID=2934178 RepID=A0ABD3PYV7_9STRA